MEEVYFEDLSPWHHLIFCKKLVSNDDGENDDGHDDGEDDDWENDDGHDDDGEDDDWENDDGHDDGENDDWENDDGHDDDGEDDDWENDDGHDDGENDDWENDVVPICWECGKSVVGHPVYKCLECKFHQHVSCINQTQYVNSEIQRNLSNCDAHPSFRSSRPQHHLILIEDVKNTGNEEVVVCAAGCEEPVFGRPAYKCSIPDCNFFLHKWCTDLPHLIQHPMHPEHTLFLEDKFTILPTIRYCDACGEKYKESLFYRCSLCNFKVDVKCANSRWRINAENCHQHAFVTTSTQIQFTCQDCGEGRKSIAYLCSICRLMIHRKCAQFLPTIKTLTHEHPLTRTYSLRQVKKQQDKAFCKLCSKPVNIEYGAYYCQRCDHIAHLNCAYRFIDYSFDSSKSNESMASNSDDYRTHVVHLVEGIKPVEDPREIQHSLSDKKLKVDHKRCDACMQFIIFDGSFYSYAQWPQFNSLLHNRCTELPPTITRMLFHQHPLTLISKDLEPNGFFWCDLCRRSRNGFAYRCDICRDGDEVDIIYDFQCCLIPDLLDHEGHPHPLYMSILPKSDEACNACGENVIRVKFNCNDCSNKFTLCMRCATLPLVARYEYDAHLLQLAYTREYDPEEYYCLICEKKRNPDYWFYYCEKCKFTGHPRCVIGENPSIRYGRTYKDENHQHPLTIVEKTKHSPPCNTCGKPFKDGVAVECTQCKFNVHHSWHMCLEKYQVKE